MRSYPHQSRKQLCEVSFLFGAVLFDAVVVVVECNCLFLWSNECVVASIRSVDIVSQRNEHFWGRNQYRRMHGWAILRANKKQSDKKFGWSLRTVGMSLLSFMRRILASASAQNMTIKTADKIYHYLLLPTQLLLESTTFLAVSVCANHKQQHPFYSPSACITEGLTKTLSMPLHAD